MKKGLHSGKWRRFLRGLSLAFLAAINGVLSAHSQTNPTHGVNLVQNGTFKALWDYWQGHIPVMYYDPQAPNGVFAVTTDIYQFIQTTPGQSYFLSFYSKADQFSGPGLNISLLLNHQKVTEFGPPPFGSWRRFTATFIASSAITRLEFTDLKTNRFGIADVSLVATGAPPLVMCSMPLNLASSSGSAVGTVSAEVQSSSGELVAVVWSVNGIPLQTNFVSHGGAPVHTNLTLTALFATGEQVVTVSAFDGHTSPFTCSTTVKVHPCPLPNVIANGSFENGFTRWTGTYGIYPSPNPVSGRNVGMVTDISHSSINQCLSQTIPTVSGTTYQINFGIRLPELYQISPGVWVPVAGDSRGLSTTVLVQWNNLTLRSIPVTSRDWRFYRVDVLSMSTNNTLTFYNGSSSAWPFVDDVSVTPAVRPSGMICPAPLVLDCVNGSALGTLAITPPASCGNPHEILWAVNGVPIQTNSVPSSQALPPTNVTFTASFGMGEHLVTVSASSDTNSTTCSTLVTVRDRTPPIVTILGPNPMTNGCDTLFTDPGATAVDACAGTVGLSTTGTVPPNSPGVYSIHYSATDPSGNATTTTRTVVIVDTSPPRILGLSATPNVLWPPNKRMVPVRLGINMSDTCASSSVARITKVTSTESSSASDWVITGALSVDLRAERSGNGEDRIYTLWVEASDPSGNKTTETIPVIVPHARPVRD